MFSSLTTVLTTTLAVCATTSNGLPADATGQAAAALERRGGWLSNVDMVQACQMQYGGGTPVRVTSLCNGWRCDLGDKGLREISVDDYCKQLWGPDAFSQCHMTVWDWQCQN
ncbi:hypothetical protein V8F06_010591 [Rhypophila decipiens]